MGLFQIEGTITAVGASQHDIGGRVYSFIEFTEAGGRRIRVEKIGVSSQVDAYLEPGTAGVFYFDRLMGFLTRSAKHLWGIKTSNGEACFDPTNIRFAVGAGLLVQGLVLSLFIIGLPLLVFAIFRILGSVGSRFARERMFYGSTRSERRHVRAQEAVRI